MVVPTVIDSCEGSEATVEAKIENSSAALKWEGVRTKVFPRA
jgi:hypothetical protein